MLDKSRADKELARGICAAFISYQMGVSITTQYKKTPEDVGDLWYFARRFGRQVGEGEPGRLLRGCEASGDRDYSIGDCHCYTLCGPAELYAAAKSGDSAR